MADTILSLLGNYVFPIVACIGVFWYMTVKDKDHKAEITTLTEAHKEEIKIIDDRQEKTLTGLNQTIADNTKAINQMTIVITQLSERIK